MLYIGLLLSNVDKNETEIIAELGARLSVNKSFFQKANRGNQGSQKGECERLTSRLKALLLLL